MSFESPFHTQEHLWVRSQGQGLTLRTQPAEGLTQSSLWSSWTSSRHLWSPAVLSRFRKGLCSCPHRGSPTFLHIPSWTLSCSRMSPI